MRKLIGVAAVVCWGFMMGCPRPAPPEVAGTAMATATAPEPAPGSQEEERGPATAPEPAGPDLVIGAYLPLTGPMAAFAVVVGNGIALAVEEQNRAGGVRGRRIVLRTADTAGRTSEAATAVSRLVADHGAVAILGDVTSAGSLAGGPIAQHLGVPMISPAATHPDVTTIGDMISRACMLDEDQTIAMASFARRRLKLARVAVLYDASQPYSSGLATMFQQAFAGLGGTIATVQAFSGMAPDLRPQLEAIRDAKVDAVYVPAYYASVGPIARKLRALGVTAPLLGTEGWDSTDLVPLAGPAIDGSYYTHSFAADDPRPIVKQLVTRYRARFGADPDGLAALGYDAARLLFAAMARARSLSGEDLAAAIAATNGFVGATGSITMGPGGEPKKPVAVLQIRAGKPVLAASIPPP